MGVTPVYFCSARIHSAQAPAQVPACCCPHGPLHHGIPISFPVVLYSCLFLTPVRNSWPFVLTFLPGKVGRGIYSAHGHLML